MEERCDGRKKGHKEDDDVRDEMRVIGTDGREVPYDAYYRDKGKHNRRSGSLTSKEGDIGGQNWEYVDFFEIILVLPESEKLLYHKMQHQTTLSHGCRNVF